MDLEHTTIAEDDAVRAAEEYCDSTSSAEIPPLLEIIERLDKEIDAERDAHWDEVAALRTVIREQRARIIKLESQ